MEIVIGGLNVEVYKSFISPDVKGCKDFFLKIWVVAKRVFSYYILRNSDYFNNAFLFEKFKSHSYLMETDDGVLEAKNILNLFKKCSSIEKFNLSFVEENISSVENHAPINNDQEEFIAVFGLPMFRALGGSKMPSIPILSNINKDDQIRMNMDLSKCTMSHSVMKINSYGRNALIFQTVRIDENGNEEDVIEVMIRKKFNKKLYWDVSAIGGDMTWQIAPSREPSDEDCDYGKLMFKRVAQLMKGESLGLLDYDKLRVISPRPFENPLPKGIACIKLKKLNGDDNSL